MLTHGGSGSSRSRRRSKGLSGLRRVPKNSSQSCILLNTRRSDHECLSCSLGFFSTCVDDRFPITSPELSQPIAEAVSKGERSQALHRQDKQNKNKKGKARCTPLAVSEQKRPLVFFFQNFQRLGCSVRCECDFAHRTTDTTPHIESVDLRFLAGPALSADLKNLSLRIHVPVYHMRMVRSGGSGIKKKSHYPLVRCKKPVLEDLSRPHSDHYSHRRH